jgi:AcrR family transcriptional regulator
MSAPVRRKWRGVEPDTRTATRRDRLIAAAIELLETEGAGGTTVRGVCARAKLHSRYFYESFADIDALLIAVFDEVAGAVLGEIAAAVEAAPDEPRARLSAAITTAARIVNDHPERIRILVVEALGNEQLTRRRVEQLHAIARLVEQEAYRHFGTPAPGERIGATAARFLVGGLAEMLLAWVDGEIEGSIEECADDVMELILGLAETTNRIATSRARQRRPRARTAKAG